MLKRKKVIVFTLIFMLIVTSFAFGQDVTEEQMESANKLVSLGILTGYADGSLKLDKNISRGEFATIAVRLICKDDSADQYEGDTIFKDVKKEHWASKYINVAVEEGLINGYTDGTFKPEGKISYAEVLTILVRLLGYEDSVGEEDPWPLNYVKKAVELGINKELVIPMNSKAPRGDVAVFVDSSLLVELKKKY